MSTPIQELLESVEKPLEQISVRNVFGEPIEAQGKTIIPIARIAMGFGGGDRHGRKDCDEDQQGAGGGGGMIATPWGYLEVSGEETKFVQLKEWRRPLGAAIIGLMFGVLFASRRAGKRRHVLEQRAKARML